MFQKRQSLFWQLEFTVVTQISIFVKVSESMVYVLFEKR